MSEQLWSDERIVKRWREIMDNPKYDNHQEEAFALADEIRDDLQARITELEAQLAAQQVEYERLTARWQSDNDEIVRLTNALEAASGWEPLPDGVYLDGAVAITYNGKDIGLKVDDSDYGDDWQGNYQWLSDCEIHDYRAKDEEYRLCRRTQPQPAAGE